MALKIGIDIGGVCSSHASGYEDDLKSSSTILDIDGCLETLYKLVRMGHHIYIVSFCGAKRAVETQGTLINMYPELFTTKNLFFVKKKTYKDLICQHLGLDVMIDDRIDIINSLTSAIGIYFIGDPAFDMKYFDESYQGLISRSWTDINEIIMRLCPKNLPCKEINLKSICYIK